MRNSIFCELSINAMADTPPNYDNINTAFNTLGTEFHRIRNTVPLEQNQQIVDILQGLQEGVQELREGQRDINQRLTVLANSSIQSRNHRNLQSDPSTAILQPLRNITLGRYLPPTM
ncbi:hypothetical protein F4821DRAFT_133484 [Hypoxylon rubiginosum]|uniref:Uncharacterized protein n=1 Tax=Hypoxylon rubiginosum TaxID=110542 RepID=A0ACC0D0M7_9PEZI|nr:hypothetical protein F4821DRAFT_133484 [Hypoxylon rubiginosum]